MAASGPRVGGLLLAAGGGSRLGQPKALVELAGGLLVERGVRMLAAGGSTPVVVVLGAAADRVRASADLGDARVVVNRGWQAGMGSTLRVGLDALADEGVGAAVVALVDQPLVGPGAVARLTAAWREGAVAAVATYGGQPRNPVLLDRSVWPAVREAAVGDAGARRFLRSSGAPATPVPCDGTGRPDDVDTAQALARVRRLLAPIPTS